MTRIPPSVGLHLCDALQLDPDRTHEITLTVDGAGLAMATITRYLTSAECMLIFGLPDLDNASAESEDQ